MLRILIKVLEQSVKNNGADTKLTIGHLLNICKVAARLKNDEVTESARAEAKLDQEHFEETMRYGNGS